MAICEKLCWALLIVGAFFLYTMQPAYAGACDKYDKTEEKRDDFPLNVDVRINDDNTATLNFKGTIPYTGTATGSDGIAHGFQNNTLGSSTVTVPIDPENPSVDLSMDNFVDDEFEKELCESS